MFNKIPRKVHSQLSGFSRPQFGQLITWFLIYVAIEEVFSELPAATGDRAGTVTVLSFLPGLLDSAAVFILARWVLVIAGILWALQLLLPFSSWLTAIAITTVVAIRYENADHISHVYNLTNMVLVIHAMWYHFHYRKIKEALGKNCFWQSELYPNWAFYLSLFCIAIYHTFAGLSKLVASGPQWANGLSLQLWVHLWGRDNSFSADLIVSNRAVAQLLQCATLIIETLAITAVLFRRLRWLVGLGLVCLYVGILDTFNYRFHFNMILLICFFFPLNELLNHWSYVASRSCKVTVELTVGKTAQKLIAFCVERINMLGITKLKFNDPTGESP